MDKNTYFIVVTLSLFVMIFVTRALPFFFSRVIKNSVALALLGEYLPAYIVMLLVLYEVGMKNFARYPYGIPAIISLVILFVFHAWKRNLMVSIFCGVISYVIVTALLR